MNPQAIISALPWLRKLWKVLPPPLRVPLLLIGAAIGVWQFLQARKAEQQRPAGSEQLPSQAGQTNRDMSPPGNG